MTETLFVGLPLGIATTTLTQPFEFIKTRIQLRTEIIGLRNKGHYLGINPFKVASEIHATGVGMSGFYSGLSASILSRTIYLSVRNTIYKIIYDNNKPKKKHNDLTHK